MSPSAARDGRRVPRPQLRDLGRGHPQRVPAAGQPPHPRDQPLPHPQPQCWLGNYSVSVFVIQKIVSGIEKIEMRIVCQTRMIVCLFEGIVHCVINV